MNRTDWLVSSDPEAMMAYLKGKVSDRKMRLIVCACSRGVWPHLHEADQEGIGVAEAYADGLVKDRQRAATRSDLAKLQPTPVYDALARSKDLHKDLSGAIWWIKLALCGDGPTMAGTIRDVAGDLQKRAPLDPTLRTATILSLAEAAYAERTQPEGHLDSVRLSILADALEDAGCADALVAHLRSTAPHVRGCWAVDAVLGKS